MSVTHINEACNSTFLFGPAPCGGVKWSISLTFDKKVNFKDFIPNFVCVLTNKRYKTYGTGFSFCGLVHAPGVELGGAGGQKFIFFRT